jgi:hypothetical protein
LALGLYDGGGDLSDELFYQSLTLIGYLYNEYREYSECLVNFAAITFWLWQERILDVGRLYIV